MVRKLTSSSLCLLPLIFAATGWSGGAHAQPNPVTLTAKPARVCFDPGAHSYPNFDLMVRNSSDAELTIGEVRGAVLSAKDEMIEQRLVWQGATALLAPDDRVSAQGEATIFNPFAFSRWSPGSTLRYEVVFNGPAAASTTSVLTVTPQACPNPRLIFPISGRVLVLDGYDFYSHHRRSTYSDSWSRSMGITDNFQRFGLDLVVVDAGGRYFTGDGSRTDQWLGWGRAVRAAGSGTIVAMHDGQPDNVVIGTVDQWTGGVTRENPMSSYGNYVLIDHGGGEFTLAGHLKKGSVTVNQGDRVKAGQHIGQIGNSGASGGVHVHFERRTGPGIAGMETLPAFFSDVALVGAAGKGAPMAVNTGDVLIAR